MTADLKPYQQEALEELSKYLRAARETDAERAFNATRRPSAAYKTIPGWRESKVFPYVCVRIPTGGGKTLLAAHAVGSIARDYLHSDRQVVLWLAPTDAIVQQTLKQLRDRGSRVYKAVASAFGGQVAVLTVGEALYLSPATLTGACTIIVSTAQSWRVEGKEGRKVYQPDNGALMGHFDNVDPKLLARLDKNKAGKPVCSLANVLKLHRPTVIIDEGHRFRTRLTFDTLKRFDPAAVVEFTATPYVEGKDRVPSNVLVEKTAKDLKDWHMIKAPIMLKESKQWTDAVRLAVAKRKELQRACEAEAKRSGEYIRPIILFKAEDDVNGKNNVTVDRLREHLIKEKYAAEHEVVIHVGGRKDLPDNILKPECKVNHVITVDALGEGWDCPFAYILCTIATLSSSVAVEQILGRVLRMPYVTPKNDERLNRAYCFTSSGQFGEAAANLKDALVDAGFSRDEAEESVKRDAGDRGERDDPAPLFRNREIPVFVGRELSESDRTALAAVVPGDVRFETEAGGTTILYKGDMLDAKAVKAVARVLNDERDPKAAERFRRAAAGEDTSPAGMGEPFVVPGLAVPDPHAEGGYSLFDAQHRETLWTLANCDCELDSEAFDPTPAKTRTFELGPTVEGEWVDQYKGELAEAVLWQDQDGPKTLAALSAWLDREIEQRSVTQDDKRIFIDRVLNYLTHGRGITLEALVPVRWRLAQAIAGRINDYRIKIERAEYQLMMRGKVLVLAHPHPSTTFAIDRAKAEYPGLRPSTENRAFPRHYFPRVAEMGDDERRCAQLIDTHENTRHWVRNIDRHPSSFWLPGLWQRFYPDFVAELRDGRYAAVEFKMKKMEKDEEELAKRQAGELWEARSNGRCVFVWATAENFETEITTKLSTR